MNCQQHTPSTLLPVVGITMGDPVGIGPEILVRAMTGSDIHDVCRPVVIGDSLILKAAMALLGKQAGLNPVTAIDQCRFQKGVIDLIQTSVLSNGDLVPGRPTERTGRAMLGYVTTGIDLARQQAIHALVTCPITKTAMKLAGSEFHGHTELLASRTGTRDFAMMLAGDRLKVVLVTIHIPLSRVPEALTTAAVYKTIRITHQGLTDRFGIRNPAIAVAGLNPHAGEEGMFGSEEDTVIRPAVDRAQADGIHAQGPLPPDTVFYSAMNGRFDAVVCMYHDQGLIPFKLIHFRDGVNTTLGLPIIRTSVDHGTAYDIAFKGTADHASLTAAVRMAAVQAANTLIHK